MLRTHDLGEADRIVTLLTRKTGRVRAVAKGVRRTRSRFGARLEPGSVSELQLWASHTVETGHETLDIVSEATSVANYGEKASRDYASYTVVQAVLEAAGRFTAEEREPAPRLYALTIGALHALGERDHAPGLVLDAYLLRAMRYAGYSPALIDCARCGDPGPHRAFSVQAGGSVCPECRPNGAASPSPAATTLMVELLEGRWAAADASDAPTRTQASALVGALVGFHLERGLRSLPLVERA